jgi:hypothetical protein
VWGFVYMLLGFSRSVSRVSGKRRIEKGKDGTGGEGGRGKSEGIVFLHTFVLLDGGRVIGTSMRTCLRK